MWEHEATYLRRFPVVIVPILAFNIEHYPAVQKTPFLHLLSQNSHPSRNPNDNEIAAAINFLLITPKYVPCINVMTVEHLD
jgi:hypothetical protein